MAIFETDFHTNLVFFLRWIHIFAGIIWIGHLYFFNFVNVPLQGVLDKDTKPKVNPHLLPRALWWFRWGAMSTFVIGLILLFVKYGLPGSEGNLWRSADGEMSGRALWIMTGATLGTIMWFNVWFVIWPAQRQIITWVKEGQSPAEMPALAKRALLFSRANTYLSAPMLFCMIAPNNYGAFDFPTLLAVSAFGVFMIWGMIRMSFKVGQTV